MHKNNYGKRETKKVSKTVSENANETTYNFITKSLNSRKANISESINTYSQLDFVVDTNFFSQDLQTFECLAFLSDGNKILPQKKLKMLPYFK